VESAAILFTVLLVFLEISHAINGGDVYRDIPGLTETALHVCAALAMAIGLERLRIRTPGLDQLVAKLSGGNQQKVVLSRWLARRPKLLILDEPTRGIDVGAKAEIYRLIAQLAGEGMALLVISSEMPELLGLADRLLVMAAGRIAADLPRTEATEERILDLAMGENLTRGG